MKPSVLSLPYGSKQHEEKTLKLVIALTLTLILLTIIPLYCFPLLSTSLQFGTSSSPPSTTSHHRSIANNASRSTRNTQKCDLFRGEWIPNPKAPYYTNNTCWAIHDHQNCMKFGRPDTDFLKWRWKPNGCELPIFNPAQFLEIVRGKSLAFVGDSVGRNQMQSLMCLLNRVTYAVDVSPNSDEKSKWWSYPTHNFTVSNFWSPFLVRAIEADPNGPTLTGLFNLYLDEPDSNWTARIGEFDYVIVSVGHWFFRPTMFYEGNHLIGCHYCLDPNVTDLTMYYSYKMAFRTTFRTLIHTKGFKGMTFLRTFAPSHFENGEWNKGGNCVRRRPFRSNETRLEGLDLEMYMTQLEEFRIAEREAEERGFKLRLLDTTEAMLMRPDGHPSRFGHPAGANVTLYNDCVHWCLPGPVDAWNDFLLEMLKMEGGRSASGKLHSGERRFKVF